MELCKLSMQCDICMHACTSTPVAAIGAYIKWINQHFNPIIMGKMNLHRFALQVHHSYTQTANRERKRRK